MGSDAKTVHLIACPICGGQHRVHIKHYGPPLAPEDMPTIEMIFQSGETKCPKTGETFYADADDWEHLTEGEYHRRFPGTHSN
jgi:hypothetical protein